MNTADRRLREIWVREGVDGVERWVRQQQEIEYGEGMEEVKKYHIKNVRVPGSTHDTGWVVEREGRCWTTWRREIHIKAPPHEVVEFLEKSEDYPGWTGVQFSFGISTEEKLVFSSTYDSGD